MSAKSRFHVRLTAIALCLATASLTAACGGGGGGGGGGEASANEVDAAGRANSASAPVPSGAAFACDFSNGWRNCGFTEQAKELPRATIESVAGVNAVRMHTEPGDNNVAGSGSNERNDLRLIQATTDGYEGREHWWAHSILFPIDYFDPPESPLNSPPWNWGALGGFHNTASGAGQGNLTLMAMPATATSLDRPTGLSFQIAYGNQSSPTTQTFPIGPVVRNVWYNFVYHVKWTSKDDGSGFFDAWVNGVPIMTYRGPTLYANQGVYLKLGNYHTPFNRPSSVMHARVIRSDTTLLQTH